MAKRITIDFELKYKEAAKNLDEFQKEYTKLEKQVQKQNDATAKSLENIEDSSSKAAKGIKGIGNAIKAAGIGLAIAAFTKLVDVFNENQKVADFFNTTFEVLSLTFNDFFKFLDQNVGTVINYFKGLFENPVQSLKNFGQAIVDNVIERISSALDALGFLGEAVVKVFAGDFAGAAESAKDAGKELFDVVTGVNNTFDKVSEVVPSVVDSIKDYAKSTYDAAKGTVELNKQAEVASVINQGLIEKYDRQAEQQRQIRDDESKTIEERIAANEKLAEVLEEQQKLMLENVDTTIAAAQAEYDKNQNQENYIALLEAQNEREAVLAQIEGFRSEQLINRISLEKELDDVKKEAQEKEAERINDALEKELDARQKAADAAKKIAQDQEQFKQEVLADGLSGVVSLVGENSKFAKGIAIANAVRDTYAGASKALAQGGIFGAIGAASIIAAGLANVRTITSTDDPAPPSFASSSVGGGASITPPAVQTQAPDFNVVGVGGTNQLADAISGQQAKPQRAYVVSNDVTTAQGLDRNIVESASI
jgi:hypothetical protein